MRLKEPLTRMRFWSRCAVRRFTRVLGMAAVLGLGSVRSAAGDPLDEYVRRSDPSFACHEVGEASGDGASVVRYTLTSQTWRGGAWTHDLVLVRPAVVRPGAPTFLQITGSGDGSRDLPFLRSLAAAAGVVAAVVTHVPNQPLLGGKKEDDLISLTFQRYLETGDLSWPALFPMVKSVSRALDCLSAAQTAKFGVRPGGFILSGASKRGWTTWLTAAVDGRVAAIAPKVFDMLNMPAQTELAARSYGGQSDEISEYTDKGLVAAMKHPRMQELLQWVDPYRYRERLTMPKLLLLGTNDPYWVVDSLSEYWADLRPPKFVFQSPNTGHHLGEAANSNLAAWVKLVAERKAIPELSWSFAAGESPRVRLITPVEPASVVVWRSCASTRDFRKAVWTSEPLSRHPGERELTIPLLRPEGAPRYCAYLAEAAFSVGSERTLTLSTEAYVLPR